MKLSKKPAPLLTEDQLTPLETMSKEQIQNFVENLSAVMGKDSQTKKEPSSLDRNSTENYRDSLMENILKTTGLSEENARLAIGGL